MSKFEKFMKANKKVKENEKYAVSKNFTDEGGNPLEWEFRHITSKETEDIREDCTFEVPVTGRPNVFRPKFKSNMYIRKIIVASVVSPNLYDAELQDSYGVKNPEDLILAMVDEPGEYNALSVYVQQLQGLNVSLADKVEEAKN